MGNLKFSEKTEADLNTLENQIDNLIKVCEELTEENSLLRSRQASLVAERAKLIEKTEFARARIEAMMERLRAMETEG